MKRAVTSAFVAVLLLSLRVSSQGPGSPPPATPEFVNGREAVAGEVLVRFRDLPDTALPAAAASSGGEQIEEVGRGGRNGLRLVRSRTRNAAALLESFSRNPNVLYASPNFIVRAVVTPNDTYFPLLWGLFNTGQTIGVAGTPGADIDAPNAWNVTTGSRANVVGIVDTGIDYTHPDLVANVWSAPAAFTVNIAGQTINCAAGSHGFNALNNLCDPKDDHNHGTHVFGTIGGVGDNAQGVAGVNWVASVMGLKFLNSAGSGTTAGAINAIEFAIQAKGIFGATGGANIRVLSNSWGGGGFSQPLLDEIKKANDQEMLFVAAAGNNGTDNDVFPFYPAVFDAPNVVAVAATDNQDARAWFSNYGATTVDLGAPGLNIVSTIRNNGYAYFSGTSMATPHVSGAAALVLSRCSPGTIALRVCYWQPWTRFHRCRSLQPVDV